MKQRKEQMQAQAVRKTRTQRFQIVKLEERIAPNKGGIANGGNRYCYGGGGYAGYVWCCNNGGHCRLH